MGNTEVTLQRHAVAKPPLIMKKLLPSFQTLFTNHSKLIWAVFILVLITSISFKSQAQLYFVQNDNSAAANDKYVVAPYAGGTPTTISTGQIVGAIRFAIDGNNNRLFAIEASATSGIMKVMNLTTGALIRTITSPRVMRSVQYDAASDYIYYSTEGIGTNANATLDADDAIYRIHPDGTGLQTVATNICENVYRFFLDLSHNQIVVYQSNYAKRQIITINIANPASPVITRRSFAITYIYIWDVAFNPNTGHLYYMVEGGNGSASTAGDFLARQNLDGTGNTVLITNFLYNPMDMVGDWGNNRLFVSDPYAVLARIVSVNLSNNTYANVPITLPKDGSFVVQQLAVPEPPNVTTASANTVSSTSATLGGDLVFGYGLSTERGIVYSSTNAIPTLSDSKASMATNVNKGTYAASVTGLSPTTTYYARAYAVNGAGTTYGAVTSFTTLSNDNNLSAFTISSGTLSPTFTAGTTTYTTSIINSVTGINITPTKNNSNASITVNGTPVNSGAASSNISLNVGNNTITTVVTAQDNSTKTYTLTATRDKTPQTITFNASATKTYGDADFSPGATTTSGLTISYSSGNTDVATIVNNQIHIVGQGTAVITATQAGDATYLPATNVTQTLTVNRAPITVTAHAKTKIYGDADPTLTYTITTGTLAGNDTFTGSLSRNTGITVGNYPITLGTLALNTNYVLTFVSNNLTVTKRPLILAPIPATKVYGNPDPGFAYAQNGTSYASTDAMTGIYSRAEGENVGTYALGIGTKRPVSLTTYEDMSANYDITFISNNLTITKRPLIFHPVPATKVYGNVDPGFPYMLDGTSVAPGEGITGTFGRTAGEDVGTYAFTLGSKRPVNITTGVFTADNYDISFVSDNLTITPRSLNIFANAQAKTYGDPDPTLTTYIEGSLKDGDALTGSLVRAPGENVGTYAITKGTLSLSNNYTYTFTGGNFTINKKTINVTANAKSKTFGDPEPTLNYIADALLNGESFSGSLSRAPGENIGTYAIAQNTLAISNNYAINYTGADLSITKKIITVTANAKSKTYGQTDPILDYTHDPLVGNDTFTGSISRALGENAGTYAIGQGTLALSTNYGINFITANLNINKGILTYTANPTTRFFKVSNPTFTGGVTGFVNGETITNATTGTLLFTSPATTTSSMGSYAINGSGLTANNYSFIQAPSNSTALTVVASGDNTLANLTVTQGTLDPTFSSSQTNYAFNVANGITSFDLATTTNSELATIKINNVAYTSGNNVTLPLNAGYNRFEIVVTAQDETTKQYVLGVNRAYSTNNLLTSLIIPGVTFTPAFDPNITTYHATVPNSTASIDLIGIKADSSAVVLGNGGLPNSAENPLSVSVSVGEFSYILPVTAQNGVRKDYVVIINRLQSSDASLASFGSTDVTLNIPVNPSVLYYNATVAHNVDRLYFIPTATSNRATITVNGNPVNIYAGNMLQIGFGDNTLNVVVTSEDGTNTKTYTLAITRTRSSDANLGSLVMPYVTTINEQFNPNVYSYTANVADSTITGLPFTAISANPYATLKVNGTTVTRFDNYFMTLQGGPNTFKIVVTSQDGTQEKTYTFVVTRAGQSPPLYSPIAKLASLTVSSGTSFSKNFNLSYEELTTVTAPNSIASVRLFLNKEHPNSTITLNGAAYDANLNYDELHPINVGDNLFTVVVTAEDRVVTRTYEIHINRLPYVNVDLASLAISKGTLTPSFSNTTTTYAVAVPNHVETIAITPVAANPGSTIQVNGIDINTANPTAIITLYPGLPNRIRTIVRAADGVTTKTYSVNVTRSAYDVRLAGLTLSSGTLSPVFDPENETYTANVPAGTDTITLTPIVSNPEASIKINGSTVTSGSSSSSITLTNGVNLITVIVKAADSTTTKTYQVSINRIISKIATLSKLSFGTNIVKTVSTGAADFNYTASAPVNTTAMEITAITVDPGATVTINGQAVASGTPITLPFTGQSTTVTTTVTAQDGKTIKTYVVLVSRNGSSNASLSRLYFGPNIVKTAFTGTGDFDYTASAPINTTTVDVTATTADPNATVTINGQSVSSGTPITLPFTGQSSTVTTTVTAEDGTTKKTYTVTINRNGSSNASLSRLYFGPNIVKTAFTGTGDFDYTASAPTNTTTVDVTATTVDPNATVTINGQPVSSGTPITLPFTGQSATVTTIVTAEDGTTKKTYTVTINRNGSSNASLSKLYFGPNIAKTLSTGIADFNYTASAPNNTTTIEVTATTSDPHATITINGQPASNGVPITLPFTAQSETVTTTVTAEDGTTTKTYSVIITRKNALNNRSAFVASSSDSLSPDAIPIVVRQALSPNGDGNNDVLTIDGITSYPDNTLRIMNRAGATVFEIKGYDNSTKVFDGRSNNGTMQTPGTYFYTLEYKDNQKTKRKTGFIVIKY